MRLMKQIIDLFGPSKYYPNYIPSLAQFGRQQILNSIGSITNLEQDQSIPEAIREFIIVSERTH